MSPSAATPDPAEIAALAKRIPPLVRFGASSWNYPGWRGLVYHRTYEGKGAPARMLEEYSAFPLFRTVGIDSSFYAPPTDEVLRSYAERLPAGFPCVSKVWNQITVHAFTKAQDPARAGKVNPDFLDPEVFLEAVYEPYRQHFADHTGPFVFEFQAIARGSGIGASEFAGRLDRFFSALPREGQYAVEVRNEEFLTPMYFAVLREHGVAHVFSSWTRMPAIGDQLDLPGSVSGLFLIARALLRPGRTYDEAVDAFAPYDRIQEPNPELRRDILRLIDTAVTTRIPAYLLVNNRAEGSSPLTVAEVARLLPEAAA
ncbi:MAG: DUF72 domain-containing protein [Gemmatimonadales bacterium]|nr:DUF72 domain-containing protein [Gemmatimonadales bacterium]